MKKELRGIILIMVLMVVVTLPFVESCTCNRRPVCPPPRIIYIDVFDSTLTKENLWAEINQYPFHDHELVMKSAIYEVGHGLDSKNALVRNNLFGMTCGTRADSCEGGYAVYLSWHASVEDRFIHESLHWRGGSYRKYINRHWGVMDGRYTKYLDKISINL